MAGNVYASSFAASSAVFTSTATLNNNSQYAIICDTGCTLVVMPQLGLSATNPMAVNNRMFLIKNISASAVTVSASGSTFDGGAATLTLQPNGWVILHGQNDILRWNVYIPETPGARAIDVTYAQLMNLIGSTATTGVTAGFYRITDFRSAGYYIGGSGANYLGAAQEPLIVNVYHNSAMGSTAQVSREAFSPLWPNDVIYYDPFPQNWVNDKSFCLNYSSSSMVPNFKGVIFYRHDLKLNIKGGFDWRYCQIRRWATGTLSAYSTSTVYVPGDVVTNASIPYACVVRNGATGAFNDNNWVQLPASNWFPVTPINNEAFAPASSVKWDLSVDNYAQSTTGATFSVTIPVNLSSPTDSWTFGSAGGPTDYIRNIDLGSYNWGLGETLLPLPGITGPTGATGATAGSASRKYTTIVNQNYINPGSLGVGNLGVGFNRVNNITMGARSWGNHFDSAGFVDNNDIQNIHVQDRFENCYFYPYPTVLNLVGGASSINTAAGFKGINASQLVNCAFVNSVLDSDLGSVRDSMFVASSNIRLGHQNAIGSWEFTTTGPTAVYQPTKPMGFSLGNIVANCANVSADQVRYSHLKNLRSSAFRDVFKSYFAPAYGEGMSVTGDLRSTSFHGGTATFSALTGSVRANYMKDCVLSDSRIGTMQSNFMDGSSLATSDIANLTNNHLIGLYLGNTTARSISNTGATSGGFMNTCDVNVLDGLQFTNALSEFFNNRTSSSWSNVTVNGSLINVTSVGDVTDCYVNVLADATIVGGMTGVTGLTLSNASIMGGALNGLNMSGATGATYSKLYMRSDIHTPWMAKLHDNAGTVTWQFYGPTA